MVKQRSSSGSGRSFRGSEFQSDRMKTLSAHVLMPRRIFPISLMVPQVCSSTRATQASFQGSFNAPASYLPDPKCASARTPEEGPAGRGSRTGGEEAVRQNDSRHATFRKHGVNSNKKSMGQIDSWVFAVTTSNNPVSGKRAASRKSSQAQVQAQPGIVPLEERSRSCKRSRILIETVNLHGPVKSPARQFRKQTEQQRAFTHSRVADAKRSGRRGLDELADLTRHETG